MALGERVMVLEGLRGIAEPSRYTRVVGGGGAGGKGIAGAGLGYNTGDCDTCTDVGEYEALVAQRLRLAQRAVTMRASVMRRAAQGDAEARAKALDMAVAEGAAKALAANAAAQASIARQLRAAAPAQRAELVDSIRRIEASSAAILKSDRSDWIPDSGGYMALMGRFGAVRKRSLAGLGLTAQHASQVVATGLTPTPGAGAWVMGADGQYHWDQYGTYTGEQGTAPVVTSGNLPPGVTQAMVVDLAAQQRAIDAALYSDGKLIAERETPNATLSAQDQVIYDRAVSTGYGPFSPNGGGAAGYQISVGALPFKVTASQVFYYNRTTRLYRVTSNDPTWLSNVVDAIGDAAGDLARAAVCIAAKATARAALLSASCVNPVDGAVYTTKACRVASAAQVEILRRLGCSDKALSAAANDEAEPSKFGGVVKIAIPALLAVLLLGGK